MTTKPERIREEDLAFVDDLNSAILIKSPKRSKQLVYSLVLFILVAILWAAFANIDEVTRGQGKVIPSQQLQIVQNLEGGILKNILVQEGDLVSKDQPLLTIDETRFKADFREQNQTVMALQSDAIRYRAELNSINIEGNNVNIVPIKPDFSLTVDEASQSFLIRQESLFDERIRNLKNQLEIIEQQIKQRQQEYAEVESKISHLETSYSLISKELNLTTPLAAKGVVSEVELIKLERQANEVKSQLEAAKLLLPKISSALEEQKGKQVEVALSFRSESQQKLAESEGKLVSLQETLVQLSDRLERTTVKSPVKGTIKNLKINTVGGVIQPGMDLIEIVPMEDSLLIEARVSPKDIAFIRPGLNAVIKLTAYDFTIYGGLKGTLEHISADTDQDENGNSFYLVRVRTEDGYFDRNNQPMPIMPGMTATIDVITGKRTILEYLLKPIIRARQNALKER